MRFKAIEKTIEQIIQVQILTQTYLTRQQELQKRNQNYKFDTTYYQLRNQCEGIRIKKLQLIRRKNQHLTYSSFS